eukprot:2325643-Rhodomonas_salina.2
MGVHASFPAKFPLPHFSHVLPGTGRTQALGEKRNEDAGVLPEAATARPISPSLNPVAQLDGTYDTPPEGLCEHKNSLD